MPCKEDSDAGTCKNPNIETQKKAVSQMEFVLAYDTAVFDASKQGEDPIVRQSEFKHYPLTKEDKFEVTSVVTMGLVEDKPGLLRPANSF